MKHPEWRPVCWAVCWLCDLAHIQKWHLSKTCTRPGQTLHLSAINTHSVCVRLPACMCVVRLFMYLCLLEQDIGQDVEPYFQEVLATLEQSAEDGGGRGEGGVLRARLQQLYSEIVSSAGSGMKWKRSKTTRGCWSNRQNSTDGGETATTVVGSGYVIDWLHSVWKDESDKRERERDGDVPVLQAICLFVPRCSLYISEVLNCLVSLPISAFSLTQLLVLRSDLFITLVSFPPDQSSHVFFICNIFRISSTFIEVLSSHQMNLLSCSWVGVDKRV